MEENQNQPQQPEAGGINAQQAAEGGQLRIQKVYTKDISFETPNSPSIFFEQTEVQPKVEFQIGTKSSMPAENTYEVVLNVTVTLRMDKKTAFLVEVHQAGLFAISGFSNEQLSAVLGAYCPNLLFPFARETVSDLVTRGGFPQLLLEPMNFDALYAQQINARQQQQQQEQEQAATEQAGD